MGLGKPSDIRPASVLAEKRKLDVRASACSSKALQILDRRAALSRQCLIYLSQSRFSRKAAASVFATAFAAKQRLRNQCEPYRAQNRLRNGPLASFPLQFCCVVRCLPRLLVTGPNSPKERKMAQLGFRPRWFLALRLGALCLHALRHFSIACSLPLLAVL